MCDLCGDPFHTTKDCDVLITIKCPRCGSGTYIPSSGVRACVNAFCNWAEDCDKDD